MQFYKMNELSVVQVKSEKKTRRRTASSKNLPTFRDFRKELVENLEIQYFKELISFAEGKLEKACRISGLSRSRLYAFLQKHNLSLRQGISKAGPNRS